VSQASDQIKTVQVALGSRAYDIQIGQGLLSRAADLLGPHLGSDRVVIISDNHVAPLWLKPLQQSLEAADIRVDSLILPAGEATKSFSKLEELLDYLLTYKVERKDTLIALGGGVIGDLVGFAASILRRGVPFIQVPTSLLAQVDSSVGGKTAVNSRHGKNLLGAFYQPQAVLIDTDTLDTLPAREVGAGYAEVIKYGALGDIRFFEQLENGLGADLIAGKAAARAEVIATCCAMKAHIVAQDERESGVRALLNLGHTFGHGLEAIMGYDGRLLHGEAVGVGMVLAAEASAMLDMADAQDATRLKHLLSAANMPASVADIEPHMDIDALITAMGQDKKAEAGQLVFILGALGAAEIVRNKVDDILLKRLLTNSAQQAAS